jgi:protein-tyrosine phosphatase
VSILKYSNGKMLYQFYYPAVGIMQNANEIIPRVWLGNRFAAWDEEWLKEKNIRAIFNCTKDLRFAENVNATRYRVPVDDNLEPREINNMTLWSPEIAYKVTHEYNQGKNILIHCAAGMQRSAAVLTIFLITITGESAPVLMSHIRRKRHIAFVPQANFRKSIEYYDKLYHNEILAQLNKNRIKNLNMLEDQQ